MPPYYTYQDPYPTTPQDPYAVAWDNPASWPKAYDYVASQGLHPPGPVYQLNQGQPGQWPFGYGQNLPQGYGTVGCTQRLVTTHID